MPSPHKKLVVPGEHYFEKYQKARKEIQQLKSELGEYKNNAVLMWVHKKVVDHNRHLESQISKQKIQLEQLRARLRKANEVIYEQRKR